MGPDLERLARAHYEAGAALPLPARHGRRWARWDELPPEVVTAKRAQVRALLTELMKPSEGMLKAAQDSNAFAEVNSIITMHAARTGTSGLSTNPLPIAFTAMIAHVLADGEGGER